jgi:uncharacterized protein (DUF2062 family)/2-polyprenyl-3-methyl-5-hydroxy-6-metoxy-1,4-benzoquinol methylase
MSYDTRRAGTHPEHETAVAAMRRRSEPGGRVTSNAAAAPIAAQGWRRRLEPVRRVVRRIVTERTTPARTALAVGLGVLIGTTPFFGFHLAICLVVATLLGLNRALTYLAANISAPWIAPFLIVASVETGSYVLVGHGVPFEWATVTSFDPRAFGHSWLVGSLVVGSSLGLVGGVATFFVTRAYRRRHPLEPDVAGEHLARAAAAYAGLGKFAEGYARGKLRIDPVYRQLLERAPLPTPVLDVGTGRGQTLILLAQVQPDLVGLGFDWDLAKIELARRAAAPWPGLRFERGDVRTADIPTAGTVLLLDVLHYNPAAEQDAILRRVAAALAPGGVIYVRELDGKRSLRASINRWQERIGTAMRINRGATLCFRPAAELVAVLAGEGLVTKVVPSSGDLPLANVLIEARRPT